MNDFGRQKQALMYSLVFILFVLLSACRDPSLPAKQIEEDKPENLVEKKEERVLPPSIAKGTHLKELYFHEVGMSLGPHYVIQRTEEGTFYKFTLRNPLDILFDEGNANPKENQDNLFLYATKAHPSERASVVKLSEEKIQKLEEIISIHDVLSWDGFSEHFRDKTLDSGDRFEFLLTLTDGTRVYAQGYNAVPLGYQEFRNAFLELLEDQLDFSVYQAKNFRDSKATGLLIEVKSPSPQKRYAKLELSQARKQWTVVLRDPKGEYFSKDREISAYAKSDELPFDHFLELLSHYGFEELNGFKDPDLTYEDERIVMRISFEDGKEYDYIGNLSEEKGEAFKEEFMQEVLKYYEKVKE